MLETQVGISNHKVYINEITKIVVLVLGLGVSEPNNKVVVIYRELTKGDLRIATKDYFIKNFILTTIKT